MAGQLEIRVNASQAISEIQKLKEELAKLPNIDIGKSSFATLDKDIKAVKGAIKQLNDEYRAGTVSTKAYQATVTSLKNELSSLEQVQRSSATGFKKFRNDVSDAVSQLPVIGSAFNALASPAGGIAVATGLLVSFGNSIVQAGASAEKAFDSVDALLRPLDNASADQLASYRIEFEKLKNEIIQVGADTPFTTEQVAGLAKEYASAGFSAKQVSNLLQSTADLKLTDDLIDLSRAGELVGSTLNVFKIRAEDSQRVVDALAKTASSSAVGLTDIGESLKFIGPVASSAGVDLEEVLAVIGVLGNAGVKGGFATRALTTSIVNLSNPTKQAKEVLDTLGVSAYDAQGNFVGLKDVFKQVYDATQGLTQQQKDAALSTVFGNEALTEMITLIDSVGEGAKGTALDFNTMEASIRNSAGAAEAVRNIKMDNLRGDVEKLSGAWNAFLVGIYGGEGAINNFLRSTIQAVTSVVDYISALTSSREDVANATEEQLQSIQTVSDATNMSLQNASLQSQQTATDVEQNMSMATDNVAKTAENAGISIGEVLKSLVAFVVFAGNATALALKGLFRLGEAVGGSIAQIVVNLNNKIQNSGENLGNSIRAVFSYVSNNAKIAVENISNVFSDSFSFISTNVSVLANNIAQGFKSAGAKGANLFISQINKIAGPINSILEAIGVNTRLSFTIPKFDETAYTVPFKRFQTSIRELEGFVAPVFKDTAGIFDNVGNILSTIGTEFVDDINGAVLASEKAFNNISDSAQNTSKKVENSTNDTASAVKALDKVVKDLTKDDDKATTGGVSTGGGGSSNKAVKDTYDERIAIIDAYKKKVIAIEDEINKARSEGRDEDVANNIAVLEDLKRQIEETYGTDVLDASKTAQEAYNDAIKEASELQVELLKNIKKSGDSTIKTYDGYLSTLEKIKASESELLDITQKRAQGDTQQLDELQKASEKNVTDRAFELAKSVVELDKQIATATQELSIETDATAIERLNQQIATLTSERNINNDLLQTVATDRASTILQEVTAYEALTAQQQKQIEFEKAQLLIEEKRNIIGKTRAEIEALIASNTLSTEGTALAKSELEEIASIEKVQARKIELEKEAQDERIKLEEEVSKIRLDTVLKAYETDLENATKIKKIWEEIAVLRGSNISGVAGATGVFHAGYVPSKSRNGKEINAIIRNNEAVINPNATVRARSLLQKINTGLLTDRVFEKIVNNSNSSVINKNRTMNGGVKIVVNDRKTGLDIWNNLR